MCSAPGSLLCGLGFMRVDVHVCACVSACVCVCTHARWTCVGMCGWGVRVCVRAHWLSRCACAVHMLGVCVWAWADGECVCMCGDNGTRLGGARFRWGVEPWGCRQVVCDVTPTQKVGVIGVELWH